MGDGGVGHPLVTGPRGFYGAVERSARFREENSAREKLTGNLSAMLSAHLDRRGSSDGSEGGRSVES